MGSNDLDVVGAGPAGLATITNQVQAGYADGAWNGPGISSAAAAASSSHLTLLGVILNNNIYGTANGSLGTFDTINPGPNDVLIKYTYYGDANLDGQVDGTDYGNIDNAFLNNAAPFSTQLTGWFNGDFNFDGVINGSDYTLIDNAFNNQGASLTATLAMHATVTSEIAGRSAVPEPTTIGLLIAGTFGLLGRRPRHAKA